MVLLFFIGYITNKGSVHLFASTHRIIAKHVISDIHNHGFFLNAPSFIWGNIEPDFAPTLVTKKHYPEESLNYVTDLIFQLCQLPASVLTTKDGYKRISVQIGVICHFLTDFFTLPHSLHWDLTSHLISHLKYETTLHQVALSHNSIVFSPIPIFTSTSKETILGFIQNLQDEYKSHEDYLNDILFSVRISALMVRFILKTIRDNKPNVFAQGCTIGSA